MKNILAVLGLIILYGCGGGSSSNSVAPNSSPSVSPAAAYTIAGVLNGLSGGTVVLSNNGSDSLTLNTNGSFSFAKSIASNGSYLLTVTTQPTGQVCTVTNGAGSGVVANIGNISVVCSSNTHSISGSVSGLASKQQVTLLNNGADAITVNANAGFSFVTPIAYNGSYMITVATQPVGQHCTVSNGSGAGVIADIANVSVVCSSDTYRISGTISGLANATQVTLLNNGADPQIVTANGAFNFKTPIAINGSYSITVGTAAVGQQCTVSNASGAGVVADINNVNVVCASGGYTVSAMISGLMANQQLTLLNNGSDPVTVNANGTVNFVTPVANNGSYSITVGTQPAGQQCTVTNAVGAGVIANINNINIVCSSTAYSIAGTVSGLGANQQVTLLNNGADPKTVSVDGSFSFTTPVAYNGSYAVTISTLPKGQQCSVSNGNGGQITSNVTNVNIVCSTNFYNLGGTVNGLPLGQQITLLNNGGSPQTISASGPYLFTALAAYRSSYLLTVGKQPFGLTCTVANQTTSFIYADVTNADVNCAAATELPLYSLNGKSDGGNSYGGITLGRDGNFYGVTTDGKIFKLVVSGKTSTYTVLYALNNTTDGTNVNATLVQGTDGSFYGSASNGGDPKANAGTIFKLTPNGNSYVFSVLHTFKGGADGNNAQGTLTQGRDGNFYGTTIFGGNGSNGGLVYKLTPSGNTYIYSVIYAMNAATDGSFLAGGVMQGADGNLYGIASAGGSVATQNGTVFKLTPTGNTYALTVLHVFTGGADGANPQSVLTQGTDGSLYGTTSTFGAVTSNANTVFKLTPAGNSYTYSVLYRFNKTTDGRFPFASVVLGADGSIFGTTSSGGNPATNAGTIYKLTPFGGSYAFSVLYTLNGTTDGSNPYSGLVPGPDGHFYGVTTDGGSGNAGAIFRF